MKIGIDLSPVEVSPAGIGQYTISLISKLVELDKRNSYFIYTQTPRFLPNADNIVVKVSKSLPLFGRRWIHAVASDAKRRGVDIFISPSNHAFSSLFPKTIQFIHDLAPVYYPQFFPRSASLRYKLSAKKSLRKAWKVITVSESVKQELARFGNVDAARISVIYPGLNPWIIAETRQELSSERLETLPEQFILSVGTLEPRKNHINLLRGFAMLTKEQRLPLVITGKKGWYYEQIFNEVRTLGLEDVHFTGYVADDELQALYLKASGFVYPSYYEGFGMPPVEALYFNLPVLVSDIPVFHETMGNLVYYADPKNPESIAQGIRELLTPKQVNAQAEVAARFNWETSAEKLIEIIEN